MASFTRRDFIKSALIGIGAATVSVSLTGCGSSGSKDIASNDFTVAFDHGVASGDPLSDKVILWTRVTPQGNPSSVALTLQVSESQDFGVLLQSHQLVAQAKNDYTVKVDLSDLSANSQYFYRFVTTETHSPIGRCKTLPVNDVNQVKLAVMSCANYPAGYFHVYAEAAKRNDLDAVLHLGDYIYEYGMGGYATDNATQMGRALESDNAEEIISLNDYRLRYAKYRTDPGLQALHANTPFIAVWDDHEVCNDSYLDGAENHNEGEGEYSDRKLAALQAYYEWMPVRPMVKGQLESLYRKFEFGDLLSLYMLDTRHESRAKSLDYQNYIDPLSGQLDITGFQADLTAPTQQLLGLEQLTWLTDNMKTSSAKWQVLGQQVLMTKMMIPAELLMSLANPSAQMSAQLSELAQIKTRLIAGDPTLTVQEKARVDFTAPYNLDAWDGYPIEREVILQTAKAANKNLVVVAGDTHNAWSGKLCNTKGEVCGYEYATASVSSPGLEHYLQLSDEQALQFAEVLTLLVDDLEYANIHQRGYLTLNISKEKIESEWVFVDTVQQEQFESHSKQQELLL
ncbi:alkaline phosphatase D family protein [Pseudoalteromonas peptidolytica]|uniref:Alkaline phosphatase D n=1 Tax=Pseudoalteromonas peptidolytica F12-50-A1 TaxID=1315280 RepID=A0A8I0N0Y6_9GAMM|nr:alkaline phosphatase D family protein [Pseudoalteromonas peptidolytica]MBE0348730.1 alkaline phosphatase D [Pseudoalteromonas peptidolytica F12-50-A1]NLR15106.1 alkaline phosphatase D family protein [Pseudoalteromonas peptidolytica]GEK11245.1 alkaline phosphatase [Pseudoalteromonas peptidolytica]